ncbi:MAG: hypothetical protein KKB77_03755 [Bacteroidetes bacterium]|nr:hypothetical protein [Bacteroidota bacterium]
MTSLAENIDRFFTHFQNRHDGILTTQFKLDDVVCKSILLCSIIDTISKCVYDTLSNREKFTFFLDDFSGWPHRDRISLVQLHYFLEKETDIKYEQTKSYVESRFKSFAPGLVHHPNNDEHLSQIPHLKSIESQIRKFSYARLLYKFRNSVVHDFKTPGSGMDFGDIEDVYYHSMGHYELQNDKYVLIRSTWELVFPIKFLSKLVLQSIANLKSYCTTHSINPYNFYYFPTSWLSKKEVKEREQY